MFLISRFHFVSRLYGVVFVNPANMQAMVKRLFNKDVTSYQKTCIFMSHAVDTFPLVIARKVTTYIFPVSLLSPG